MPLPPYTIEEEPSAGDRLIVGVGGAVIGFVACLIAGGMFLSLVRAPIFGLAGGGYGALAFLSGVFLLRKKRYRTFAVGILGACVAWLFLAMMADGFSRGYWK
jgi:hypothetical protein